MADRAEGVQQGAQICSSKRIKVSLCVGNTSSPSSQSLVSVPCPSPSSQSLLPIPRPSPRSTVPAYFTSPAGGGDYHRAAYVECSRMVRVQTRTQSESTRGSQATPKESSLSFQDKLPGTFPAAPVCIRSDGITSSISMSD